MRAGPRTAEGTPALPMDRTQSSRQTRRTLRFFEPVLGARQGQPACLYFARAAEVDLLAARLADLGYPAVEPENPYWATSVASVTVEDPDGWRAGGAAWVDLDRVPDDADRLDPHQFL
jgi:YycE-like protein